jgi:hypothetical protein
MNRGTTCRIDCPDEDAVLEREASQGTLERSKSPSTSQAIAINAPDVEGVMFGIDYVPFLASFLVGFHCKRRSRKGHVKRRMEGITRVSIESMEDGTL